MKQLENRTLDSKIEMEIMDALDEIKAVNRRHETVDTAEVLKAAAARREKGAAAGSVSFVDSVSLALFLPVSCVARKSSELMCDMK